MARVSSIKASFIWGGAGAEPGVSINKAFQGFTKLSFELLESALDRILMFKGSFTYRIFSARKSVISNVVARQAH